MKSTAFETKGGSLTRRRLSGSKLILYSVLSLSLLSNLVLTVLLAIHGVSVGLVLASAALALAAGGFIAVCRFTSFRFAYGYRYLAAYVALLLLGAVFLTAAFLNFGENEIMATASFVIWVLLQTVTLSGVIIASLKAGAVRGSSAPSAAVLLALLAVTLAFGISSFSGGVFGQGELSARPIGFTLDKSGDYYIAEEILEGGGSYAVIPESFNGKPVGAVNLSLFSAKGIKKIDFRAAGDVRLIDAKSLGAIDEGLVVEAPRETLSLITRSLYLSAKDSGEAVLSLAEHFRPSDLKADEVYITFTYDMDTLANIGSDCIPMWIGKAGDTFSLDFASSIPYVKNSDISDEYNLHTLYTEGSFGGGYVMSALLSEDGNPLVGSKIKSSISGVRVGFEKIYRIEFNPDNDTKYEMPATFTSVSNGVNSAGFRYITETTRDSLLATAPKRGGFELSFAFSYGAGGGYSEDNLADAMSAAAERKRYHISATPSWTILPPTNVNSITSDKSKYVYGDTAVLTSGAEAVSEEISLAYAWRDKNGSIVSEGKSCSFENLQVTDGDIYTLTVTAYSENSSLRASENLSDFLQVGKKELSVSWLAFEGEEGYERIYDGTEADIRITLDESDIINSDVPEYTLTRTSVKNSGSYSSMLMLVGDFGSKYYIPDNLATKVYTVNKREVILDWIVNSNRIYDAQPYKPEAVISSGVVGSDVVPIMVYGDASLAGSHVAYAKISNENYVIKPTQVNRVFEIKPRTVTLGWSESSFTYNGERRIPTATVVSGLVSGETLSVSVSGENSVNVGVGYTALGSLVSTDTGLASNYVIDASSSCTYSITPKSIQVQWSNTSLIYNGYAQKPTASLVGLVSGESLTVNVTTDTENKNASALDYTARVSISDKGSFLSSNYTVTEGEIGTYKISPLEITLDWGATELTYNGSEQAPTVSCENLIALRDGLDISVSGAMKNAADGYTATATVSDTNYTLKNPSKSFDINPLTLRTVWASTARHVYDGMSFAPVASYDSALAAAEGVELSVSGAATDYSASAYTAGASITGIGTGFSVTNYSLSNTECSFYIDKRPVSLTWSNLSFTYDGTSHKPAAALVSDSIAIADGLTVTVTGEATRAGGYTAAATPSDANFRIVNHEQSFVINQRQITLSWTNPTLTYSGAPQGPVATAENVVLGDTVELRYSGYGTDAGSHTAVAYIFGDEASNNYVISNPEKTYSIGKKSVAVSWSGAAFVYDGEAKKPTAEAIGLVTGDSLTITVSTGADAINVGSYTATASIPECNYTLSGASFEFEIMPKSVAVVWSSDTALTFSGEGQSPTASAEGAVLSFAYYTSLDAPLSGRPTQAGSYYAIASTADTNYTLTNIRCDFTVSPMSLSATFSGGATYIYDGTAKSPTVDVGGREVTLSYYTASGEPLSLAPVEAGAYYVIVSISDTNYIISNNRFDFTIEQSVGLE